MMEFFNKNKNWLIPLVIGIVVVYFIAKEVQKRAQSTANRYQIKDENGTTYSFNPQNYTDAVYAEAEGWNWSLGWGTNEQPYEDLNSLKLAELKAVYEDWNRRYNRADKYPGTLAVAVQSEWGLSSDLRKSLARKFLQITQL